MKKFLSAVRNFKRKIFNVMFLLFFYLYQKYKFLSCIVRRFLFEYFFSLFFLKNIVFINRNIDNVS